MLAGSGLCSPTGQCPKMGGEGKDRTCHTQRLLGKMTCFELVWNKVESSELEEEGCSLHCGKLCNCAFLGCPAFLPVGLQQLLLASFSTGYLVKQKDGIFST